MNSGIILMADLTAFEKEALARIEEIESDANTDKHAFKTADYIIVGAVAVLGVLLYILGR
jgi:hypothetical protein